MTTLIYINIITIKENTVKKQSGKYSYTDVSIFGYCWVIQYYTKVAFKEQKVWN